MTRRKDPKAPVSFDPDAPGAEVFDPALRHFRSALRKGDPPLDESLRGEWSRAREDALTELVARIARSELADKLVLRGGLAARAWFGGAARDPKDADFVVVPSTLGAEDHAGRALVARVVQLVSSPLERGPLVLRPGSVSVESIWTYERAEGRRVVVAFDAHDGSLPGGTLQLDLVFGEKLREPPEVLVLRGGLGTTYRDAAPQETRIRAATLRESLAWKLLWLVTDLSPQGKDLYDAVLFAEALPVADRDPSLAALIAEVITHGYEPDGLDETWDAAVRRSIEHVGHEWLHFQADYPHLAHLEPASLGARLLAALGVVE